MMSKNFFDDNGKYHNVQNLTLEQIYANGYAAGYDQAQKNFAADLEKIKEETIEQIKYFIQYKDDKDYDLGSYDAYNYMLSIVDEQIVELKGE